MTRRQLGITAALAAIVLPISVAIAADHIEAPGTEADAAADISDFYAWFESAGSAGQIVTVINFAGAGATTSAGVYDPDVLYAVHVDNDNDNVADFDVYMRFGQNSAGDWGIQVQNIPGGDTLVEGPVGQVLEAGGGLKVYAGRRDDPFFFDLAGFTTTLSTGTVSFDPNRDFFAGLNVTSIVVSMDAATLAGTGHNLSLWATTARK